ncbi:hypothetical protein SAMN04488544_1110 [Microlunatus sagamiharensis]|uniref:Uncharacterized protein n=1 Tax=Microlunatus sagamiharensis TaxID=546874 RepID=A0A1H2LZ01_9ACTN|nr:hypothetical protein [Microlunatus sagamiharensis]SDU86149.1 hypothetical protein SAMN04488544_1110 [Microlunatus sagamiharensis]
MRSTPSLRRWSIAAAVLLVLGGCLTVVGLRARSFGWFAYSPLSDESFEGVTGLLVVGRAEAVGLAVLVLGLVLGGVCVGIRIGRRDVRPRPPAGTRD